MRRILGLLFFSFIFFINTNAKSELIELNNCFMVKDSSWSSNKFYDLSLDRYEESDWIINASTGLISHVEVFKDNYLKTVNKDLIQEDKLKKEEFTDYQITNYTSKKVIGKKYITSIYLLELLKNPNQKTVLWETRIDLKKGEVEVIKSPNGAAPYDYDILKRIMGKNFSYNDFQEFFKPNYINYKCDISTEGDTTGTSSSGTAFFINNSGNILTNHHVVDNCKDLQITYKNKNYGTTLLASDKKLDLALLKSDAKNKSFIKFSNDKTKKMQKIYVGGYPLGKGLSDDLKISSGIVSSLKGFEDNSNEIQIDAAINPGNSGGPIINKSGDLVAIAVSGLSKDITEGINFGIKSSAAESFLNSNNHQLKKARFSKTKNNDQLLEILEESTVYIFCN